MYDPKNGKNNAKHKTCFKCQGHVHTGRDCKTDRNGNRESQGQVRLKTKGRTLECDWCRKVGHKAEYCYRKKNRDKVNFVQDKGEIGEQTERIYSLHH